MALTVVIAAVLLGGVWLADRPNDTSHEQPALALEVEPPVAEGGEYDHERLLMSSSPGASVNTLSGTGPGQAARGLLVASRTSNRALLLVVDLPRSAVRNDLPGMADQEQPDVQCRMVHCGLDWIRSDCYHTRGSFLGVRCRRHND